MKKLAFLLFAFLPGLALADCGLTFNMKVDGGGGHGYTSQVVYTGMTAQDVVDMNKAGLNVVSEASKVQDKKGPYTVTLDGKSVCDGVEAPVQGVMVQGVTVSGLAKINRSSMKELDRMMKDSEDKHGKGKKKMWGKD